MQLLPGSAKRKFRREASNGEDPEDRFGTVTSIAMAALFGAIGGVLFFVLHIPLPWTLGSLSSAALISGLGDGRWLMPRVVRDVARPVLGVLAGSAFTPAIMSSVPGWWDGILFVFLFAVGSTMLGWVFFQKVYGLDRITAYFAATPGGLGELTLLGGSLGGDMRQLVLVHSVRIVAVVVAIPIIMQVIIGHGFARTLLPVTSKGAMGPLDVAVLVCCGIAGYVIGKHTRFPGGIMIASMICSAVVHATGVTVAAPPGYLVVVVQIVVGTVAGSRFLGVTWRELRTTVVVALSWAVVLIALTTGAAILASRIVDQPLPVLLLAAAPGGMAEMMIIGYSLAIETAFVITCQVCRAFFILAVAPALFQLTIGTDEK